MNTAPMAMKRCNPWLAPGYKLEPALKLLPGSALAGVVAPAATFVSKLHGGPQLLYALFFGVFIRYKKSNIVARIGVFWLGVAQGKD